MFPIEFRRYEVHSYSKVRVQSERAPDITSYRKIEVSKNFSQDFEESELNFFIELRYHGSSQSLFAGDNKLPI